MKLCKLTVSTIWFCFFCAVQLAGQLIYGSDHNGLLFTVEIENGTCVFDTLGHIDLGFVPRDLALQSDGTLISTSGTSLYEINLASLSYSYISGFNVATEDFIQAIDFDDAGLIYLSDVNHYKKALGPSLTEDIGNLPCAHAGDIAIVGQAIFLVCENNDFYIMDKDNTANYQWIGNLDVPEPVLGLVAFENNCPDTIVYGMAGNSMYEIDPNTAEVSFICDFPYVDSIFGAAIDPLFYDEPCLFVLDLDIDDSSGALVADFFADTICGNIATRIADEDFDIEADGVVDSMVIQITEGLYDSPFEHLLLEEGQTDNFTIIGSGTEKLLLVADGQVELVDIAHVLENTLYQNIASPYTAGMREITVQLFGGDSNQSNVATAFIFLEGAINIEVSLGPDTTFCLGEDYTIEANSSIEVFEYEWSDGTIDASSITINESGWYAVTVTDECGSTGVGGVQVNFEAPLDLLELGVDTILCPGDEYVLDATQSDGMGYQWQDNSDAPTYTVSEPGLYEVSVSVGCGTVTDEIQIDFENINYPSQLPADTSFCQGEPVVFDVAVEGALAYIWEDGSTEPVRMITQEGSYGLTVSFQCLTIIELMEVDINQNVLSLDLGPDGTFCFMDSVELDAWQPYDDVVYSWQDETGNPQNIINETGLYSVTVSDACTTLSDEVYYQMISCCNLYVPNVFTPNGDGLNDKFTAFSNCDFPDFNLRVFNRWGAEIFQTNDQLEGWDGFYKNRSAETGVYTWILQYFDGVNPQIASGSLTLVK